MGDALFISCTLVLLLLPFIPALANLSGRDKGSNVIISQEYNPEPDYFAKSFKSFISKFFGESLSSEIKLERDGRLDNGSEYQLISSEQHIRYEEEGDLQICPHLLVATAGVTGLNKGLYEKEIYVNGNASLAGDSDYRAIYAEKNITFGAKDRVFRWAHANKNAICADSCMFFGRLTAGEGIVLSDAMFFQRLYAPVITGRKEVTPPARQVKGKKEINMESLAKASKLVNDEGGRCLYRKDVIINEDSFTNTSLVSANSVELKKGAIVNGSIKANEHMIIGEKCFVDGAIVAREDIEVKAGSYIKGAIITEHTLYIHDNVTVGSIKSPVSIVARNIIMSPNVRIFGSVRAQNYGKVSGEVSSL